MMKTLWRQWALPCVLGSLLVLGFAKAYATPDPVQMVKSVADQLIAKLKEHETSLSSNPTLVYHLAEDIVVPHADINEMSRRVIPPTIWNKASATEQQQFKAQFTTLLVHTYSSALAAYKDQTLRFLPLRGGYEGKTSVQVNSMIDRSDGPSIGVNYRLVLVNGQWELLDLIVEGVSLIESFRSQFAEELSGGNLTQVIQHLAQHNAEKAG